MPNKAVQAWGHRQKNENSKNSVTGEKVIGFDAGFSIQLTYKRV